MADLLHRSWPSRSNLQPPTLGLTARSPHLTAHPPILCTRSPRTRCEQRSISSMLQDRLSRRTRTTPPDSARLDERSRARPTCPVAEAQDFVRCCPDLRVRGQVLTGNSPSGGLVDEVDEQDRGVRASHAVLYMRRVDLVDRLHARLSRGRGR